MPFYEDFGGATTAPKTTTSPYQDRKTGPALGGTIAPVNTQPLPVVTAPTAPVATAPRAPSPTYTPVPAAAPPAPTVAPTATSNPNPYSGVQDTGAAAAPASQPYDDSAYRAAREAELAAALRALEGQYNLTREQLLADQGEAGDQYRFIMSALQRSKEEALLSAQGGALQRGILRSGIYAGEEAKVSQDFASQEAAAAADRSQKLNAIQTAIADLERTFASGQAGTAAGVVQQQLDAMRQLADSLAADDALSQRASEMGYAQNMAGYNPQLIGQPFAGAQNPFAPQTNMGAANPLSGIRTAGSDINSALWQQMQGTPESRFGPGHVSTNLGLNYQDPNTGAYRSQQGEAIFGAQPVSVQAFYNSLNPQVQAGITQQDLINMANFYEQGIPADAAYNIAQRAAMIGGMGGVTAAPYLLAR